MPWSRLAAASLIPGALALIFAVTPVAMFGAVLALSALGLGHRRTGRGGAQECCAAGGAANRAVQDKVARAKAAADAAAKRIKLQGRKPNKANADSSEAGQACWSPFAEMERSHSRR
jgi:hypothetical protein